MKPTDNTNAALAILLFGSTIVSPALAQAPASTEPKAAPGASLYYHGADTRVGIGWDSELDARGELFQVFQSSDSAATMGELWLAKRSGGVKLSHHWANSGKTAVNKVFGAFDITDSNYRKFTLGGGQEYKQLFWSAYLSKSASGDHKTDELIVPGTQRVTGTDAGGEYTQQATIVSAVRLFTRPYDMGVGARVGHFYAGPLIRLTGGLDYEWGKARSSINCVTTAGSAQPVPNMFNCVSVGGLGGKPSQTTASLQVEKFFEGSGFSVALAAETLRRKGQLIDDKSDTRGSLMLRYEFGAPKSNFRASKLTKTVTTTERIPDPNWVAPVQAAAPTPVAAASQPAEPTYRMEKKTTRFNTNDAQETYFDLGSAKLKPAAMKELDALVARINAQQPYVELKVMIIGHTCPTGSDRNNFPLSQKRADAVKAYLISKGVPESVITTSAQAGRSPKYPEVKGQSFRNRRADTDVLIVKERLEDVRVAVPAAATTTPAQPTAPATPAPQRPMIDRQVSREVIEDQPDPWMARALRNTVPHKQTVDTYTWSELTKTATIGPKTYTNRGPVAVNDSVSATCGSPITINVISNDSDPDGDALTITRVTTPGKGTAVITGNRIVYTPAAGASCTGGDTFSYTISDGKGGTATANVNVTLTPAALPNNAPTARNDEFIVRCSTTPTSLNLLANDSDPDGDTLTIISTTQPSIGSVSITNGGRDVSFSAAVCFPRTTFTYTISDGKGGTSTAVVTLVDPF